MQTFNQTVVYLSQAFNQTALSHTQKQQLYSILKSNSSIAYSENRTNKLTETQPKNKTKPRVSLIEIRTWRLKEKKKKFLCGFK